jgi:sigma-E factor negative regulatory protein RseA
MDGELDAPDAARTLSALREEGEVRDAWRTYHLISDALRDTRALSHRFSERMRTRLAEEPTVLAPGAPLGLLVEAGRRYLLPAAAAAAAVVIVGALAFFPQGPEHPPVPLAQTSQTRPAGPGQASSLTAQVKPAAQKEPASVPPPAATDDYLLAHQGYSPRNLLQGMVPYVRTVSGQPVERKR